MHLAISKQPLISIITVVLNRSETIERTLKSVFEQRFADYEYIVVDGGSTDGTVNIIEKYDRYLTQWLTEQDDGVYDAMNKAVRLAKGQWIYFLGSDDYLICNLEKVAQFLKDQQTIYYGDVHRPVINRRYDGHFTPYKLACRNICQQSIFYPKIIFNTSRFNLKYRVLADYEFNMRCFSNPKIRMTYIPLTIAVFYDKGALSSSTIDKAFENDRMKLIKENFPYFVYLMTVVHFGVIKYLIQFNLNKRVRGLYHGILRELRKREKKRY